jgi:hypothetical protein
MSSTDGRKVDIGAILAPKSKMTPKHKHKVTPSSSLTALHLLSAQHNGGGELPLRRTHCVPFRSWLAGLLAGRAAGLAAAAARH